MFHEVRRLRLGAAPLHHGDETLLLDPLHGLADDGAADAEVRAELALGRKGFAGRDLAGDDGADEIVDDGHAEPRGRDAGVGGGEERAATGSRGGLAHLVSVATAGGVGRVHQSTAPAGASATRRRPARRERTCGPSGAAQLPVRWLAAMASSSRVMPLPGLVAEHDAAVDELLVDGDAERGAEVLHLGGEMVRDGGRGVRDGGVRGQPDRADRQVAGVGGVGDPQEVGDAPDAARPARCRPRRDRTAERTARGR